eukprot:6205776-Pleurochrysis_carterae.AAC.1
MTRLRNSAVHLRLCVLSGSALLALADTLGLLAKVAMCLSARCRMSGKLYERDRRYARIRVPAKATSILLRTPLQVRGEQDNRQGRGRFEPQVLPVHVACHAFDLKCRRECARTSSLSTSKSIARAASPSYSSLNLMVRKEAMHALPGVRK